MTLPRPSLVVVGSANVDLMLTVPHLPRPGETVAGDQFASAPGGKGANQAVAAARLGADVRFGACVGDDAFGRMMLEALQASAVGTDGVRVLPGSATGVAMILVDAAAENCIALAPGANAALSSADVIRLQPTIAGASLLVCQLESPLATVRAAIEAAHAAAVPVLLNPAPARELDPSLLRLVRFLVPNESEASALTGISVVDAPSAEQAARLLLEQGVQTVLMTLGARGVLLAERGRFEHLPAPRVDAVDTTGAGDTFVGAFAACWIGSGDLRAAVDFAQRAAAFSVTGRGAQAAMPTLAQLGCAPAA